MTDSELLEIIALALAQQHCPLGCKEREKLKGKLRELIDRLWLYPKVKI